MIVKQIKAKFREKAKIFALQERTKCKECEIFAKRFTRFARNPNILSLQQTLRKYFEIKTYCAKGTKTSKLYALEI